MPVLAFPTVFHEVAALLVLAATVGFVGLLLRQPLIVSFIAVGLLARPSGLNIVRSNEEIDLLSQLGVAVLLFLVGIKLDVKLIRSLGAVSLMTGVGQVVFTAALGYVLGLSLGLQPVESFYVAVALTFSSTIIIIKLLSDKREIDSLHGQVAIGLLIVQDLLVVLAMIGLSAIGAGAAAEVAGFDVAGILAAGLLLLVLVILFIRFIADPLTERLAGSPELLICFAIAQAALFAALGEMVGLGKELGGLLAGISLASTRYRDVISTRLTPLRDFLLLFFFVAMGARVDIGALGAGMVPAAVFSLFVLIGNPLVVLATMGAMGFRKRTGFLTGLTVAQISEFSLIFTTMGVALGHIGADVLGLVTLVGMITIAASTYMIIYSHGLYARLAPLLGVFERSGTPREPSGDVPLSTGYEVIVFGLGRLGSAIALRLQRRGCRVLGVDFNPAAVGQWRRQGFAAEYGDASDPEFVARLPWTAARWVVAAFPVHEPGVTHTDSRRVLAESLHMAGYRGKIAIAARAEPEVAALAASGVDLVLEPFEDAADRAVERMEVK